MMKHIIYIYYLLSVIGGLAIGYFMYDQFPLYQYDGWERRKNESFFLEKITSREIFLLNDTATYRSVVDSINLLTPEHPNYLEMALRMGHEFNYAPANFDVYTCLKNVYELNGLGKMDERTEKMAMEHLCRAVQAGDPRALKELEIHPELRDSLLRTSPEAKARGGKH